MGKNKKSMKDQKRADNPGKKHADRITEQPVEPDNETGGTAGNEQENGTGKRVEEKISPADLEARLKERDDKYLRLAAEFDNYRKRTLREKADLARIVSGDIISGMLPVIDDFDRAIESMGNARDTEAMKKGIELIYNKFHDFLKQKGVKEIPAMGTEFDTDLHEAVTKIPAPSKKEKGKIVDVILKGYILHDRVIRFAKVVIGE
jgi:molecular chaperone GrpE